MWDTPSQSSHCHVLKSQLSIWHFDWCPRANGGRLCSLALPHAHTHKHRRTLSRSLDNDQHLEQQKAQTAQSPGSCVWSNLCSSRRSVGLADAMEHIGLLGAPLQQHPHVEPISFGIDQILSNVEQSCMLGARMHEPEYGHSAYGGGGNGGFTCANTGYNANGGSCGMSSLGGAYQMNMGVNVNGTNVNAAGVIRVPAHRPVSGGNSSVPPVNGKMNNLTALTFPWMESNRRYTKDRFTGIISYHITSYRM